MFAGRLRQYLTGAQGNALSSSGLVGEDVCTPEELHLAARVHYEHATDNMWIIFVDLEGLTDGSLSSTPVLYTEQVRWIITEDRILLTGNISPAERVHYRCIA